MGLDSLSPEDVAQIADIIAISTLLQHILVCMGVFKILQKAGVNEWMAFIPVVNMVYLTKVACGEGTYVLFKLIPCVGPLIINIFIAIKLAPAFGKGIGMILLLIFLYPIAFLILGFGDSQYYGPQ